MGNEINIQFIIPTYNEEPNIDSLFEMLSKIIKEIENIYQSKNFNWSLLVADNSSNDKTLTVLNSYK